jgi:hypothetical protein
MSRIRRAWAVLRGREDPMHRALVDDCNGLVRKLEEANGWAGHCDAINRSLRASLDDACGTIARLSAEAKARNDLTREAHALLGRAITDDGVPQP